MRKLVKKTKININDPKDSLSRREALIELVNEVSNRLASSLIDKKIIDKVEIFDSDSDCEYNYDCGIFVEIGDKGEDITVRECADIVRSNMRLIIDAFEGVISNICNGRKECLCFNKYTKNYVPYSSDNIPISVVYNAEPKSTTIVFMFRATEKDENTRRNTGIKTRNIDDYKKVSLKIIDGV